MFEKHREFVRLAKVASKISDSSDTSWELKYELIFSEEISVAIRNTGVSFEYYDPDTTYEEDVRAYVNSVNEKADEIEKVLEAIDAKQ